MALNTKNKSHWLHHIINTIIILLLVGVDLFTKRRVFHVNYIYRAERLTPLLNPGAARSIGIGVSALIAISAVAIVGLIFLYRKQIITKRAFILLISGALGNIYDRIAIGAVRDWIHISIFPVFNIADILLTIGVLLIALHYKAQSRTERAK